MDLSEIQREIDSFNESNNLQIDPERRLLDLQSEIGELSKEALKGSEYGSEEFTKTDEWDDELADCLYALISLAAETDVNLEQSLTKALDKYSTLIDAKGCAGSGK